MTNLPAARTGGAGRGSLVIVVRGVTGTVSMVFPFAATCLRVSTPACSSMTWTLSTTAGCGAGTATGMDFGAGVATTGTASATVTEYGAGGSRSPLPIEI